MDKIKQSYFNLLMISSSIREYWISKVAVESFLNSLELSIEDDLLYSELPISNIKEHFEKQAIPIKGFITIQTCAFLDEYQLLFKILPDDETLLNEAIEFKKGLKTIIGPAISLINNSWKDLRSVRNNLLAHNWRKGGTPIMFGESITKPQNTPWIDEEFTLLVGIFNATIYILQHYKPDYYNEMHSILKEKTSVKVHHMSRVLTHDDSIELVTALEGLMQLELDFFNRNLKTD